MSATSPLRQFAVGDRIERLTITGRTDGPGERRWLCRCDCGQERRVRSSELRAGKSRSCGCLGREITTAALRKRSTLHGHNPASLRHLGGTPTHRSWVSMMARCRNPKHRSWESYGGRGIAVCDRWHRFANFLADMGERPDGLSIERKDNDGNYEPGNCRWATAVEQQANNRATHRVTLDGVTMSLSGAARILGVNRYHLHKDFAARAQGAAPAFPRLIDGADR